MNAMPYSPLPITHPARAYVPADHTDVAATMAEFQDWHAPILVCPINGDDYQREQIETAACEQQEEYFRSES